MQKTLHEIGSFYQTDKASYHGFTILYDYILNEFRDKEISFLEIGILNGSSMLMWQEYLTKAKIYGADIEDKSFIDNERITTFIVNQEIREQLEKLPKDLDIILEDGGHTMLQQQMTLNVLFRDHLKDGGIFILEDLHTSEPRYYESYGSNPNNNTINLLEDLKSGVYRETGTYFIDREDFDTLKDIIESIEIVKIKHDSITSIIRKK